MTAGPVTIAGDNVRAVVLPLGAALHRFTVRLADGSWRDIVLSRPRPDRNDEFRFGATIGRYANRIAGARAAIDGHPYDLAANDGPNHLHGGPVGFADVWWQVVSQSPDSTVLRLVSPDGDQGFPGQLAVTATFTVIDDGLRVVYRATTDAPTIVNLTIHPYFNLAGPGGTTIDDHRLYVAARRYTPTTADDLPTGDIRPVAGLALDLRAGRRLGEVLADLSAAGLDRAGGLNHNFVVDGTGPRTHAYLVAPDGLAVAVASDAPCVQIYSASRFGRPGLAIEPQDFPDGPNQAGFPSPVLYPGSTYQRTIEWRVVAHQPLVWAR